MRIHNTKLVYSLLVIPIIFYAYTSDVNAESDTYSNSVVENKREILKQSSDLRKSQLGNETDTKKLEQGKNKEVLKEAFENNKLKNEEKKQEMLTKRLETLNNNLSNRVSEVKVKLLNRSKSLLAIISRVRQNMSKDGSKIDPTVLASVESKLSTAESKTNDVIVSLEALSPNVTFSTIEEFRSEGERIREEVKVLVGELKASKDLIKEAVAELKESKKLTQSNTLDD